MANELVSILRNLLVNFESQNVSTSQSANFLEICRAQERAIEQERRDEELQRELEAVEHRNFEGIRDFFVDIFDIQPHQTLENINQIRTEIINAVIIGQTQTNKTNATIEFIRECVHNNIPVVLSVDNKKD
jgi:GH25 family lysozyme M1 (1,4-beta-N-acetylmuramidase)